MGSLRVGVPIAGSVRHQKSFSTDAHLSDETVRQKRTNDPCQKPGNIVEALGSFWVPRRRRPWSGARYLRETAIPFPGGCAKLITA
jgi:hypothetical protein